MRSRKARALLLVPALAFALLVPMARPAAAEPGAAICAVAGTVSLSTGVGSFPPGSDRPGSTYTYAGVGVVCVGAMTGISLSSQSSGGVGVSSCGSWAADGADQPGIGPSCGEYDSGVFSV